jgi:hypothetical protein
MSISVTRALSEIKLIRQRMKHALGTTFIGLKSDLLDEQESISEYQSYTDLLTRYNMLKSAIVKSDAVTIVILSGKSYTVADAKLRKRTIQHDLELLFVLQTQLEKAKKAQRDRSLTRNPVACELLDPLNVSIQIRTMKKNIEDFVTQVDWVVSESNAKTMLDVNTE